MFANSKQRLVRAFISHTSDLAEFPEGRSFVQAALDAVGRTGLVAVDMRYFAARDGVPAEYCRRRVRECDVYVALVGFRYGSVAHGEKVSYTELEFDEATIAGIPRLVFLLDEAGRVPAMVGDADRTAVDGFRQRLRDAGLVVRTFTSGAGLELEVFHALLDTIDPHNPPPPRELPPDVYPFTGRSAELDALDSLLVDGRESSAAMISAVSGTAGVGKTALAVHWAHRVVGRFPDGQLYVDLRGYDPDQPMPAGGVLATLLRALGVNDAEIPYDIGERAARYRTLLAGRRMLVVLDNASSVEQVRLLLPGTPSCVAIVTSRDSLGGLVARYGARRIDLDVLSMHDAVTLLRTQVGERVEVDPEAAVTLATQCARLPLALRVAAELAATRPAIPLALLVNELADQQRRLDLMDAGGDPRTAVRAVFSWSYRHLPDDATRAFRLLGLHPGADLDLYAAAALTHTGLDQAQRLLDLLARAHLIDSLDGGRYGMHDLLRAYAASLAGTHDTAESRRAALTRLFDYYLATAVEATDTMYPAEQRRRPRVPPAPTPTPSVTDPTAALAWLDAEQLNLVATCAQTAAHGWHGHTIRLAATLFRGFNNAGRHHDNLSIQTHARHAADHSGDRVAEAQALINIGAIHWAQGRYALAAQHLQQALALVRKCGDRVGEARVYSYLGLIHWRQGSYEEAVVHQRQAQTLFHEAEDRFGEAYMLANLGLVYERQGRYEQAAVQHRQALTHFCQVGDRPGEAFALGALGSIYQREGRYAQAADHLTQSLIIFRQTVYRVGEAHALSNLGLVYQRQGHYAQAVNHLQQALAICHRTGYRVGEAETLNNLGEAMHAAGDLDHARTHHTAALTLAAQIGERYEEARAHDGLARTYRPVNEYDQACHHWQQSLGLYTQLGVPEADKVRATLAALDRQDNS